MWVEVIKEQEKDVGENCGQTDICEFQKPNSTPSVRSEWKKARNALYATGIQAGRCNFWQVGTKMAIASFLQVVASSLLNSSLSSKPLSHHVVCEKASNPHVLYKPSCATSYLAPTFFYIPWDIQIMRSCLLWVESQEDKASKPNKLFQNIVSQ